MPRNNFYYNTDLLPRAHELRRNMTRHERHLWYDFLRTYPIKIYRQRVISGYVADFYCPSVRLIIELDGSQHFTPEGLAHDACRTTVMQQLGIMVLRFTNHQIDTAFNAVCTEIDHIITARKD